ncbi:MAG TPA: RAMP superfamily CRISPR-associated protein [Thermoanaerobaculia bacterium]|jgi:CRISPR-associated protein Cmr4
MKLAAGAPQLLRLEAVTALHTGSAAGEAALDRPVQKDAQTGLPFLPDSALKGVLAGRYGDVPEKGTNPARESRFGSPDRSGLDGEPPSTGRPGPIVLGNGELLAFPVPSRPGPLWAFPALTLAWALRCEPAAADAGGLLPLLSEIERSSGHAFAWPEMPLVDVSPRIGRLSGVSVRQQQAALVTLLRRLAGPSLPADAPLAVLSSRDAGRLWPAASDRRALTALDSSTRTVAAGALRRVELIPPGALFLSLVTCEPGAPADLCQLDDGLFQIGAWESLGLGWVRPSPVPPAAAPSPLPPAAQADPPSGGFDATRVMVEAHQAVRRLIEEAAPPLRRAVRSAARRFGGRAQFSGLEAAFAFELAKAKPSHSRPAKDARAHRWLLAALLSPAPAPPAELGPDAFLLAELSAGLFTPGRLAARRELILTRWLWLARYLDTDPEVDSGEDAEP